MTHPQADAGSGVEFPTPDWSPFQVLPRGTRAEPPRRIDTPGGVADRLRAAAFAEIQAREAFLFGARTFTDATEPLKSAWRGLALAEDRHLGWLLKRMEALGLDVRERPVSDQLWVSLVTCKSAREFSIYMASAEDRGRRAGERFYQQLLATDPVSAGIFGKIAEEEVEHIALVDRYFPGAYAEFQASRPKPSSAPRASEAAGPA